MSKRYKCSRCQKHKTKDQFHKDNTSRPREVQRYCKQCKKKIDSDGKYGGKYVVYMLPRENYVGMTKNVSKRMQKHRKEGRVTSFKRILFTTRSAKLAHLVELVFHMFGFNGFRY